MLLDQMDGATAEATTAAAAGATEETTEAPTEEPVEYGPQLPDNYVPPSDELSSAVPDASSRKRPAGDDDSPQDIDNMLDDALQVKRVRLDEGV